MHGISSAFDAVFTMRSVSCVARRSDRKDSTWIFRICSLAALQPSAFRLDLPTIGK
jgi:hypothetical protein